MCLGVPGEIVELNADLPEFAEAEVNGVRRAINIGLLEPGTLMPGDWVLIHLGFAMSKIDESDAKATLNFLTEVRQACPDEPAALADWGAGS